MQLRIQLNKILNVIFFLLVATVGAFDLVAEMYLIPKAVMLVFFVLMLFYFFRRGIRLSGILIVPTVFLILEIMSVLWAVDSSAALTQLSTQIQMYVLFLFVYEYMNDGGNLKTYFYGIYTAGYLLLLYTIYKYGLSGFLDSMMSGDRMGGDVTNENTFALIFANAALVAFYLLIVGKTKLHLISVAAFVFFSLSSGSRKAAIILALGFILIAVFRYGVKKIGKLLLSIAALIVVFILILQSPIFSSVSTRLESFFSGNLDMSAMAREDMIDVGWRLITDNPLLGYGLQGFGAISGFGTYSHNNFIEIGVILGLIAVLIYYIPYVYGIYYAVKSLKKDSEYMLLLVFILLSIITGYAMVQFYTKEVWILFGIILSKYQNNSANLRLGNNYVEPLKSA